MKMGFANLASTLCRRQCFARQPDPRQGGKSSPPACRTPPGRESPPPGGVFLAHVDGAAIAGEGAEGVHHGGGHGHGELSVCRAPVRPGYNGSFGASLCAAEKAGPGAGPAPVRSAFGSGAQPLDQIQQVAHVPEIPHIVQPELQAELPFHGGEQVDLLQAVPVLDVVGAGLAGDYQFFVVEIIVETSCTASKCLVSPSSKAPYTCSISIPTPHWLVSCKVRELKHGVPGLVPGGF